MTDFRRCKNCYFYRALREGHVEQTGRCMYEPPYPIMHGSKKINLRPDVLANDYCHRFWSPKESET